MGKHYEVWFDEFSLKVGESIFQSVSNGLRDCDFGVVILSPYYLRKKWTADELKGLFAMETAMRRIILPVWLNVTQADVLAFSPILADRNAAQASSGVESVAQALELAIASASEVRAQDDGMRALDRAIKLSESVGERERSARLLDLSDGVKLVREQAATIIDAVIGKAKDLAEQAPALKLSVKFGETSYGSRYVNVYGRDGILERLELKRQYSNSAASDSITIALMRYTEDDEWNNRPATVMNSISLGPFISSEDRVFWQVKDKLYSSAELIEYALDELITELEGRMGK